MKGSTDPFFPDGLPALVRDVSPTATALVPLGSGVARRVRRPPGTNAFPDALTLLRALRNRWLLALTLGMLLGLATGAAAWRFLPRPKFSASAVVEVKLEKPNLLPGTAQARSDLRSFQANQLQLIHSRLVLRSALEKPGISNLPTLRAQSEPLEWLADNLNAEFPPGSELMTLSLAGERSSDLIAIVNAIAEAYLEQVVTKDHNDQLTVSSQLQDMLDHYNDELTRQRAELKGKAEAVGSDDKQTLAVKQQMAVQQLADEKRELQSVRNELKQLEAELTVRKASGEGNEPDPIAEEEVEALLDREPSLERLKGQIAELTVKLDRTRRLVRNEGDPSVREIKRTLEHAKRDADLTRAALRPKVEREVRAALPATESPARRAAELDTKIKSLSGYETRLAAEIKRLEEEAQAFNRNTIDLQWLKDKIAQGEEIARQLGKQIESLNVELRAPKRGRLIERAETPRVESSKKRLAGIGLASLGMFGATVLGVALREYRLRRVGSIDEVCDGLGLRLVGTLPMLPAPAGAGRGRRRGDDAPSSDGREPGVPGSPRVGWQARLIESIDAARTVILRDCRTNGLRTLLVTSAAKGEGKSSLCGHLAISLARTGRRTLLADFDLRNPSVHKLFDLERGPGVGELLRGEAELDDVYHAVADELDVITAGHGDARAIRALGQDALPDLLARMAEHYEFVVIDSAPILPVADSLLISQHVDAVLLSVYRDVSRIPTVYAGYERLASLGVRVLGAVVTGMPEEHYGEAYHYAASPGEGA
ncbi:MAG: hypothetical protein U0794_01450 [Isosphaeraceae bacterium]